MSSANKKNTIPERVAKLNQRIDEPLPNYPSNQINRRTTIEFKSKEAEEEETTENNVTKAKTEKKQPRKPKGNI